MLLMLSRIFLNATYINFIHGQLFPSSSAVISLRQLTKFAIIMTQPLSDADDFSNEQSLYGCLGSSIYAGPNLAITHKYHQTNSERCFIAFSFSVSLLEYWILSTFTRSFCAHKPFIIFCHKKGCQQLSIAKSEAIYPTDVVSHIM